MSWLQKNFRTIAVAESFRLDEGYSIYAAVLARRDGYIESAAFGRAKLGGTDGTQVALEVIRRIKRPDVHVIMLDGCIVSFYNWIDGEIVWRETGLPTVCYVFEEPEGDIKSALMKIFDDWEIRWQNISKMGNPVEFRYPDGGRVFVRAWGLSPRDAFRLAALTRKYGNKPEPLRVAKILASAGREFWESERKNSLY
ncbi:DUF99 family protein [Thermoproteus tenax]|uniref:UPF0215 protein TTX_1854 n=1 Tax=Thermoproteus tenax (strain ATCC 35583 / DSM 2078 / JCM 9277 / NBRC 100435 / Kra 1) TaxID=768679 RepID=G4RLM7_THETK|nr:DUF99 family protein [Thermoproteus tenax]CCC82472.1 Endonuclease V homolog [Thermoproteus tenax Kra 1]